MNRRGIFITLTFLFFLACLMSVGAQTKNDPKDDKKQDTKKDTRAQSKAKDEAKKSREAENTSKVLKRWIDEDVAYIITDAERAAWKGLKTDEEREQFIESFWLRRDPTPDTIDNEYRDDHYERIAYANEHFASGIPGWKSDRGRIYIMYGKPDDIESHPSGGTYDRPIENGGGTTSTFPFEIWRYRYIEGIGNEVLLEFVDPSMSGEYKFTIDPSEKDALLHVPGAGLTFDEEINGLDKSKRMDRAGASIGNPLGNTSRVNPFDRLQLLADIYKPPEVKYKDLEAVITTRLSYNVLPFDYRTDFVRVSEDMVLMPVTIAIHNKDFAWQEQQGVHSASGHVLIEVTSVNGRKAPNGVIEDNIAPQPVPDSFFKQTLEGIQVYQKVIPLKPGLYKIDIVVKDMNSGNVSADHRALPVPRFPDDKLTLSSLIFADLVQSLPPNQVGTGAFALAGDKVRPAVTSEFLLSRDKNVNLWFQVYNLKLDETTKKPSATIETIITRNNQEVKRTTEQSTQLANAAAQMTVSKSFPVTEFEPGIYSMQVKVTDNLTRDVIVAGDKFTVR
jgi:GWxTD domain-containing protein